MNNKTDAISHSGSINSNFVVKNVPSRHTMVPTDDFDTSCDKNSLIFYERLKFISSIALFVGYIIFCVGLFFPIIILKDGIYSDHSIFTPRSETLLHSLIPLYKQGDYFTIVIALTFSIILPCIKIILTFYAVFKSTHYKELSLGIITSKNLSEIEKTKKLGKLCDYILFSLKFICKFQFVDSIVILLNVAVLKNSFIVSSTGQGILCIIIYCLISIPSAQILYHSFYEESKILNKWVQHSANLPDTEFNNSERHVSAEISVVFFSLIVIFSSITVLSHEKLLFVGFTIDKAKQLIISGTDFSYFQILSSLSNDSICHFSHFVLLFLGIIIPILQAILFLLGIVAYNLHLKAPYQLTFRREFETGEESSYSSIVFSRWFIFFSHVLSDWSCADVLALALVTARSNLSTSPRVVARIPPSNSLSAFYMVVSFGISSFAIQVLLHQKVVFMIINEYERVTAKRFNGDTFCRNHSIIDINKASINTPHSSNGENEKHKEANLRISRLTDNIERINSIDRSQLNSLLPIPTINPSVSINQIDIEPTLSSNKNKSSVFFPLLFNSITCLLVSISVIYSYAHTVPQVNLDVEKVQKFIYDTGPEIFNLVQKHLPASVGLCSFDGVEAPKPCMERGSIYTMKTAIYFQIPWVSGINSLKFTAASINRSGDRLSFGIIFRFVNLDLFSIIGSCIFSKCHELYRGNGVCCGNYVGISIRLSMRCSETDPVINDIRIQKINLSNIHLGAITENFVNKFVDVRKLINAKTNERIKEFLDPYNKIIDYQEQKFSIQDLINYIVRINAPAGLICNPTPPAAPGAQ